MGIKIRIPEFEIEMPDIWGSTAQEVAESLPKHYREFCHFLEEHGGNDGFIVILDPKTGFRDSVDFVWANEEGVVQFDPTDPAYLLGRAIKLIEEVDKATEQTPEIKYDLRGRFLEELARMGLYPVEEP